MMTTAPASCAAFTIAGMSCTSKVCEPGELGEDDLRLVAEQLFDPGADQGVVIDGVTPSRFST